MSTPVSKTKICDFCQNDVEIHLEGWTYDHAVDGTLSGEICEGSGQ